MTYLLDTDHINFLQRPGSPQELSLSASIALHEGDVFVSIVSYQEQHKGALAKLNRTIGPLELPQAYDLLEGVRILYSKLPIIPFTALATGKYSDLLRLKLKAGRMDQRIASIA